MKAEQTKREGFRIQDSGFRIFSILDPGSWILNPYIKSANRFLRYFVKNYKDIAG